MRVLITGATSGIGQQLALQLVSAGHQVDVVGGKNQVRGRNLVALSHGKINYYPVDLSDVADIKRVAAEYLAEHRQLDRLVLNAGTAPAQAELTSDGLDQAFVVNYLHRFMFLLWLRPLLLNTPAARVLINGASNSGTVRLTEGVFGRDYQPQQSVQEAYRACGMLAYWLNHVYGYGVEVDAIYPGYVKGNMTRHDPLLKRLLNHWSALQPAEAAESLLKVLTREQLELGGNFFQGGTDVGYRSGITNRQANFQRLWQKSLQLAQMRQPHWVTEPKSELHSASLAR